MLRLQGTFDGGTDPVEHEYWRHAQAGAHHINHARGADTGTPDFGGDLREHIDAPDYEELANEEEKPEYGSIGSHHLKFLSVGEGALDAASHQKVVLLKFLIDCYEGYH